MAGAAILSAKGALRAGAGLVTVSVPYELLPIIQTAVPEAICISRILTPEILSVYDAVAIGPGLGLTDEAGELVSYILENFGGIILLDADALTLLSDTNITLDPDTIITPHPGEAARLLGTTASVIQTKREATAAILAEKYACITVLKGAGTLVTVTNPNFEMFLNTTGNPGMATGGSGDVLAGVIASFAAQGMPALAAAKAGVFVHGLAGDFMAAEYGESGLLAGDLPYGIAIVLKKISE
jgi:NAD(P)H-hydrate epimerase